MARMTDIVRGEASESDDEQLGAKIAGVFASEVSGEASESDEDVFEKAIKSTVHASAESIYRNNLLQRKLIENNVSIWNSLNGFVRSFVVSASKQILATDQLLIKSQVSMQSVLSSLKLSQANIKQLQDKSGAVFTANFIPNIGVPE